MNALTNQSGIIAQTFDKPQWYIPIQNCIGAPVQVRISGENVILNNVDHSIQVYRLKANGNFELLQERAGEVAQAWRFEVSADKKSLVTSMLSLREFDIESL